jgi:hypothetical protein
MTRDGGVHAEYMEARFSLLGVQTGLFYLLGFPAMATA